MASKPSERSKYFKEYDEKRKDDLLRRERKRESNRLYRLRKKIEKLDFCTKTVVSPPDYSYIWERIDQCFK